MGFGSTSRRRRQGATLGVVLSVIFLCTLLAFSCAATSTFGLRYAMHDGNAALAQHAAECTLMHAFDQLVSNYPNYGQNRETIQFPGLRHSFGRLTFDQALAQQWNIPYSLNNQKLASQQSSLDNVPVPGSSVLLVAAGYSGDVVRHSAAVVEFPPFPFAVAAGGSITVTGCQVAAANPTLPGLPWSMPLLNLLPGSLLANGPDVNLVGTLITGDVQTCGSVHVSSGSQVLGEVRENWAPDPLPPKPIQLPHTPVGQQLPSTLGSTQVSGFAGSGGSLTVKGTLKLTQGVLYVPGNLVVDGSVTGTGALIVDGTTTVEGPVDLATDSQIALLSTGDVNLNGQGTASSFFSGLVYTEGNFNASNVTVQGSFVTNPPARSSNVGNINLNSVRLIYNPALTSVQVKSGQFYGCVVEA
ncbi:MAG: hypothetical protein ACYCW6_04550, partial [Candidatus Xenobia bacterium]